MTPHFPEEAREALRYAAQTARQSRLLGADDTEVDGVINAAIRAAKKKYPEAFHTPSTLHRREFMDQPYSEIPMRGFRHAKPLCVPADLIKA